MSVRFRPVRANALWLLVLATTAPAPAQQPTPGEPIVETWPGGAIKARYSLDEAGRPHGSREEFAANGTRTLLVVFRHGLRDGPYREWTESGQRLRDHSYRADVLHGRCEDFHDNGRSAAVGDYRDGLRHGKWVEQDDTGSRRKTADYKAGVLHGAVRIQVGSKTITRQQWQDGELTQLDDLRPFPQRRADLLAALRQVHDAPLPELDPADPIAAERWRALRRLQTYRALCGLPFQDMTLVPDWNLRCDAASEACRLLGGLSHTPSQPPGMDDARYRLAREGAGRSNLAVGSTLAHSVDQYMDDSDPSNIARIGHRRWCLNPAMRKTGFGSDGSYHAMWSMDGSGGGARGLDAVCYPPRGHVPADLFSARRAFSIALLKGGAPRADELRIAVQPLDDEYLPAGEPLPLDHQAVIDGGYGTGACIVFRAVGIRVQPGARYLVEVSADGSRAPLHRYVVEFCGPVSGAPDQAR